MSNYRLENAFPIVWNDGSSDEGMSKLELAALWIYTAKMPKGQLPEKFRSMLIKEAVQEAKELLREVNNA